MSAPQPASAFTEPKTEKACQANVWLREQKEAVLVRDGPERERTFEPPTRGPPVRDELVEPLDTPHKDRSSQSVEPPPEPDIILAIETGEWVTR